MKPRVITVFGSGLPKSADRDYAQPRTLGAELALRGFAVCTGGYGGVMEAACRGAKEAGGRTLGITAESFASRVNRWVDEEVRVKHWRDRLFELLERGDGYVVCAGGTGTLAELAVVWEMMNKALMAPKPIVAIGRFWKPVVARVNEVERRRCGAPGKENPRSPIHFSSSPRDAANYLARHLLTNVRLKGSNRH